MNTNRLNIFPKWKLAGTMLAATLLLALVWGVTALATGTPVLTTDKEDYLPNEHVIITGTVFLPYTTYDVLVIRPDHTIVFGDGSFLPGWDSVTTDAAGGFVYDYQLNGIYGSYEIRAYQHDVWEHDHATWTGDLFAPAVAVKTFTDAPPILFELSLTKEAYPETYFNVGDVIVYTYTLQNTGNQNLVGPFTVADDKATNEVCPGTGSLTPGSSIVCNATYAITNTWPISTAVYRDLFRGLVANTATATAVGTGETSDPDLEVVTLPLTCTPDADGVNDEPGQKDLTQLCSAPQIYEHPVITWNWDEIAMSGANTADACALFDVDDLGAVGYGNADYALCVTWDKERHQLSTIKYTCDDSNPDRCSGADAGTGVADSVCYVDLAGDDPFDPDGDNFPADTKAYCSIDLKEIGGPTEAVLLDVCSFPSTQPNSDPSDCVAFSQELGNLRLAKNVDPDDATTNWVMTVTGPTAFVEPLPGDGTGPNHPVTPGIYSITETAGANTNLALYDTTFACIKDGIAWVSGSGTVIGPITIQADEIVQCTFTNTKKTGTIIINKSTLGGDGTFDFTGDLGAFSLTTVNGTASQTFNNLVAGSYAVTESDPTPMFGLTELVCLPGNGTTINMPTATIDLDAGENITCTFTNTKRGKILVDKNTNPISPQLFDFTLTPSNPVVQFQLAHATAMWDSGYLLPGTYAVAETVPAGWDLTSAVCTGSNGGTEVEAAISLQAGEIVTCVFSNTQEGSITVIKQTDPDGDPTSFEFDPSWSTTNFFLSDGQQQIVSLDPGQYSVSETVPAGWDLESAVCTGDDDGISPASIQLDAGEQVVCTFFNQKDARIIFSKATIPTGTGQGFVFTRSWNPIEITLYDGDSHNSGDLPPNSYSVIETVPLGWDLTGTVCIGDDDGNTPASIQLDAGETVTCTFTNTKRGNIIIKKETDPDGDTTPFEFDPSWGVNFFLQDGQQNDSGPRVPGAYSVAEVNLPIDWQLDHVTCTSSLGHTEVYTGLDLNPNETITCVFYDEKDAFIVVDKVTDPVGDLQSFDFTFDPPVGANEPFSLTDAAAPWNNGDRDPGTYAVSETVPLGWDLESVTCTSSNGGTENKAAISLQAGETVTCTFTNEKDAFIIVEKQTDPNGDPTSFEFNPSWSTNNFTLSDGQQNNSGDLDPGPYDVAEVNIPAGWQLDHVTCTSNLGGSETGANISLQAGETVTCVFYDEKDAFIIVEKQTDPNGDQTLFDFNPSWSAINFTLSDGQQNNSGDLDPGTYSVAELSETGWGLEDVTCTSSNGDTETEANIDLQAGETVTCVFTNEKDAFIIVEKQTDPNGDPTSFEFNPSWPGVNFNLTDGQQHNSGDLDPGSYNVAEVNIPAGWQLDHVVCTSSKGDPETEANISLQAGETVTCVFYDEKDAFIVVDKVTNPVGDPQSFDFTFDPPVGADEPFSLTDAAAPWNSGDRDPGTYAVSETVPLTGWDLEDVTCTSSNGGTENKAAISLQAGETVTCVFTNEKDANIIVEKQTIPDGATQSFEIDPSYGPNFFLQDGEQNDSGDLVPGPYNVDELPTTGWDLTSAICTSSKQDNETPGNISLQAGETVSCVFTNTQRGKIIVEKQTDPNGDTTRFEFDPSWGVNFFLQDGQQNDSGPLLPGSYSVDEVNIPLGWQLDHVVCTSSLGHTEVYTGLDLNPNETITCVFYDEKDAKIIVEKQTDPNGDPTSFEFNPSWPGANFNLTDGQQHNSGDLDPGLYNVAEVNIPAGWQLDHVTCTSNLGHSETEANIDLQAGETVTCVFYDEKDAKIIVEKQTDPNGDPTSFEFNPSWSAANFNLTDDLQLNSGDLDPGLYNVAEVNIPTGWQLDHVVCTSSKGDPETEANISLQAGETVTCIFYDEKDAFIIVEKQTDPNGDPTSFEFNPSWPGVNFNLTDGQQQSSGDLDPGLYNVAEVNIPTGWQLDHVVCTSSKGDPETEANISLQAGETVTCVFYDEKDAKIIVEKQTDPNGDPTSFEFNPSWSAANFNLTDGLQHNSGDLDPGPYNVAEVNIPAGWQLDHVTCTSSKGDTETEANISLQAGETVTCVFYDEKDAKIIVEKQTDPNGDPTSFEFNPSWSAANFNLTDGQQHNSGDLDPGLYNVAEVNIPTGWQLDHVVCTSSKGDTETEANISLQAGETVTCVFYDEKDAFIVVDKVTNPVGDPQSFGFTFDPPVGPNEPFSLTDAAAPWNSLDRDPGTYAVSETVPLTGWDLEDVTCTSSNGGTEDEAAISLQAGETVTCVFTNEKDARIIVDKVTFPAGHAQLFDFAFNPPIGSDEFFQLTDVATPWDSLDRDPGLYQVSEFVPAGWDLSAACTGDDDGTNPAAIQLDAGEVVTCTFTNTKQASITIVKVAVPKHGQDFSFVTTGAGLSNFILDDDSDPTLPNTASFPGLNVFGTKTISEAAFTGWDLTNIVCSGDDNLLIGANAVFNAGDTTISIDLDPGEDVVCTFTNTQRGEKWGSKWLDANRNGLWDALPPEPAMPGWTVDLWMWDGAAYVGPVSALTDATGMYRFPNLLPGTSYVVCEVMMPYFQQSAPNITTVLPPNETLFNCSSLPQPSGGVYGAWGYQFTLQPGQIQMSNDFGNWRELGCTLTQGYWKNHANISKHYDTTWDLIGGPNAQFFDSDQSWIEVLRTPAAGGNAYYILAHQYIAAYLNVLNGADPTVLGPALANAAWLLNNYDLVKTIDKTDPNRAEAISLSSLLDDFNNGLLGPPHCGY